MLRIFSILLSFNLLACPISLTIGTHFCGGRAVESKIMLGKTHLGCGMPDMDESCADSGNRDLSITKSPCCENQYQTFQSSGNYVKYTSQISLNVDFAVVFLSTVSNEDLFPKSSHRFYADYSSPPPEKDIQVLFQSFLI